MQIFILDYDIIKAAQAHNDRHIVKQVLETGQLLCSTMRLHGIDYGYKISHKNHPCRLWLDQSNENFEWLRNFGLELSREYSLRFNKIHKTESVIVGAFCPLDIPQKPLTEFAQAIPIEYKNIDAVIAYRNYYLGAKQYFKDQKRPVWTKRAPPDWWEYR